jgi:nicotinate-nucleotide pyrophosphorylase (carboxylating)
LARLDDLIDAALAEDVGDGDVTTEATVSATARARARIVQKEAGVVYGHAVAIAVFRHLDPDVQVHGQSVGGWTEPGTLALDVEGTARALLIGERTALNFLGRLSGIATLTAQVVRSIEAAGGGATVLDTRKTTPGLRDLEKAAVAAGGGTNHRRGLYDAILIKENHIAAAGGIAAAVEAARTARPDLPLEVEVRNPDEIDQALEAGVPRLLLDNMTPDEIRAAVAQVAGRARLEVSGGLHPGNVVEYATIPGLDYVSLGALTHSAPNLDLSLLLERL